jgi:SAM-dependent methyltransferase
MDPTGQPHPSKPQEESVLKKSSYLEVTYSPSIAPLTEYPRLLATWLLKNAFKRPGRLLDMGVGRGDHLMAFSSLGFEVAGVDTSPNVAALSSKYEVHIADLEHDLLPFPNNSFDFVFSKSVIEHMHYPDRLMSKALEVLRPGGTAVLMTPSWEYNYWGPFYIDHTHVTPFTRPSLRDALTIVGFGSTEVTYFYQLPFLWRYPICKPLVRVLAALPIPYRPYQSAPWPDGFNKLVRFSKEVMLMAVAHKGE